MRLRLERKGLRSGLGIFFVSLQSDGGWRSVEVSLCVHTPLQVTAKLHAELDAAFPDVQSLATATPEQFSSLTYTRCVFEEALRLFPPAPITVRTTTSEITMSDGTVVPPGVTIVIPSFVVQRDGHNWPDEPGESV